MGGGIVGVAGGVVGGVVVGVVVEIVVDRMQAGEEGHHGVRMYPRTHVLLLHKCSLRSRAGEAVSSCAPHASSQSVSSIDAAAGVRETPPHPPSRCCRRRC